MTGDALRVGKSRLERSGGRTRLTAEVSVHGRGTALWFAVEAGREDWLAPGRADPFVMALLPGAMRGGYELVCQDPMSERLHYQLSQGLIPALASAGDLYRPVKITAPLTAERLPNRGAAGAGFSGGADSLYTVMGHGRDSELPLTHLAVFNNGHFGGDGFSSACRHARRFAEEQGLALAAVDTNLAQAMGERFLDVYSFRNYACALALGGLFSVYLLSSGHDAAHFALDLRNAASYDLLAARCASTESLTFYHAGEEAERAAKLEALSDWEPSWRWLHPCFRRELGEPNCGRCKKCVRDMTVLYALGRLERYREVYGVEDYLRHLPQRLGVLLAHGDGHLYREALRLLEEREVPIPPRAYEYERQFRRAMDRLEAGRAKG